MGAYLIQETIVTVLCSGSTVPPAMSGPVAPNPIAAHPQGPDRLDLGNPGGRNSGWAIAWSGNFFALMFLLIGCEQPRPSFLEAIQRNCKQGMVEDCTMLSAARPATAQDADIAPRIDSHDIAKAILAGMRQSRLHADRIYQQELQPGVNEPVGDRQ